MGKKAKKKNEKDVSEPTKQTSNVAVQLVQPSTTTSTTNPSMTIDRPKVGSLLTSGQSYSSTIMADHGHDYQRELFLFFCLIFNNFVKYVWRIGLEVKDSSKFDDIVIEFEIADKKDKNYTFHIQSKHDSTENKFVKWEHILSRGSEKKEKRNRQNNKGNTSKDVQHQTSTSASESGIDTPDTESSNNPDQVMPQSAGDNLKSNFSLNKYHDEWIKIDWTVDRTRKYIIMTNHKFDLSTSPIDSDTIVPVPQTANETDDMFKEIFNDLKTCSDEIKIIKLTADKDGKIHVMGQGPKEMNKNFLDDFIYISELPNVQDLTMYNNSLLEQKYEGFTSKNFSKVRNNVFNFMNTSSKCNQEVVRKTMTKEELVNIIHRSVLEVDIPAFSADFCKQFNWLDFKDEALKALNMDQKEYSCNGNSKLLSYKIYKVLSSKSKLETTTGQIKIFCIPSSKLTQIYRDSLKVFEHKVVVHVDNKYQMTQDEVQELRDCKNVILVFQSKKIDSEMNICSFEDLNEDSRAEFLKKEVKFQGSKTIISNITSNLEVLTEMLQAMFDSEQMLQFGTELPMQQKFYINIERKLKDGKTKIGEAQASKNGRNIILEGPAGVGKSTTMLKIARRIKQKHPSSFVIFIDLKQQSKVLKDIKNEEEGISGVNNRPTLNDVNRKKKRSQGQASQDQVTEERKEVDIWVVFLQEILKLTPDNRKYSKLEQLLLGDYIKQKEPRISVFLDGFDEISPYYSKQVLKIAEFLKEKKIQVFISTQPQFIKDLEGLEFEKLTVEHYDQSMQSEFLRSIWRNYLEKMINNNETDKKDVEMNNINVYTKKFMKICYKSKLTENIRSIPLMLAIIAEIFLDDCVKFCKKTNSNWSEDFLHVNVLAIYDEIFQSICKTFYRKTEENPDNVYILAREPQIIEELRGIYMNIAAKKYLPNLCAENSEMNIRKNEILGRGFIAEGPNDELIFINEDFGKYFAADWFFRKLFPFGKTVNIDMLKSLHNELIQFDKGVKSYVCRFLMDHISTEEFRIKIKKERESEEIKQLSETVLTLLQYVWFSNEVDLLEATFEALNELCAKDDIKKVFTDKKFFDKGTIFSAQYLEAIVKIHNSLFGPEITNKKLKKREMSIMKMDVIKDMNFELFEEFFNTITEREIFTEHEYKTKAFEYFRIRLMDQKIANWMFVRDMLLWFFDRLEVTEKDILEVVENILSETEAAFEKQRFFLGHCVAVFCEWRQNHETFLPEVYKVVEIVKNTDDIILKENVIYKKTEPVNKKNENKKGQDEENTRNVTTQNLYRFLQALNSITREDILEKMIEVMRQNGYHFICHDRKSVLCHAFENNKIHLVEKLLKLLTREEIEIQIKDEACGGNSIVKQCTNGNKLCRIVTTYMFKNFGNEQ